ncbi:hypothetical protein CRX72_23010 [Pantoea sp. BRM17]|nr:hypothetical protein CRX72_23010 [Pantoea sp. BRM17]
MRLWAYRIRQWGFLHWQLAAADVPLSAGEILAPQAETLEAQVERTRMLAAEQGSALALSVSELAEGEIAIALQTPEGSSMPIIEIKLTGPASARVAMEQVWQQVKLLLAECTIFEGTEGLPALLARELQQRKFYLATSEQYTAIFFTPGVPSEFKVMVEQEIIPRLKARFTLPEPPLCLRLTTFGRGESDIAAELEPLALPEGVVMGYQAAAAASGCELVLQTEWLAKMEAWFASRGRVMAASNRKQAEIPANATLIDNPVGTACGFALQLNRCLHGQIVDTNAAWLADVLFQHGLPMTSRMTVGDALPSLIDALQSRSQVADVLIVNGGLGPTSDDLSAH